MIKAKKNSNPSSKTITVPLSTQPAQSSSQQQTQPLSPPLLSVLSPLSTSAIKATNLQHVNQYGEYV
uniref:Uncharacterized protein n=1 Tax=Setaria digitata TaxID=48799 RepID=A0A915Q162_9BILA